MNSIIHVSIADDSLIHIEGVKAVLKNETDMVVRGEARTCDEVKKLLQRGAKPDVIMLGISMEEEGDGLELARYLNATFPTIKVMILSHYKEIRYIVQALQAKVCAYIAKDSSPADIAGAIRAIVRGKGIYFGETISYELLLQGFGDERNLRKGKPYELGGRELQILKMLSGGHTAKEIAVRLGINVNTVESHKEHIKNKLGVNTVIEAVVFAVRHNLW